MPSHVQQLQVPPELESFVSHMDRFRMMDLQRDEMIRELFEDNVNLRNELRNKSTDYENEIQSRRFWQDKARQAEDKLKTHNNNSSLKPFVLALIDGDGVLFNDALLKAGKAGGSEAASKLRSEIKNYVASRVDNNGDFDVVVNIYLNLTGLATKLTLCGIIEKSNDLRVWMNAFSINQSLFNFIDVGDGKERADHKLKEMLRLFIENNQCKHIIFGGCHDAGYLTFLDTYKLSERATKISLLETVAEPHIIQQFKALNFSTVGFPSVFRTTPLQEKPKILPAPIVFPVTPAASPAAVATTNTNWARVSAGGDSEGKTFAVTLASKNSSEPKKKVLLNHASDRVDVPLPKVDRNALSRVNALIKDNGNYCNEYHLAGKCSNQNSCPFVHGARLVGQEQLALRVKARNRLCYYEGTCTNADCFFGHICPNDVCLYETCYFKHLHGRDKTPAMAIDEQGHVEILASR